MYGKNMVVVFYFLNLCINSHKCNKRLEHFICGQKDMLKKDMLKKDMLSWVRYICTFIIEFTFTTT